MNSKSTNFLAIYMCGWVFLILVATNCMGYRWRWAYSAHKKTLSNAFKDPPTQGCGGVGSLAIHHPTGILTELIPF
jgi:hypothetical protein